MFVNNLNTQQYVNTRENVVIIPAETPKGI